MRLIIYLSDLMIPLVLVFILVDGYSCLLYTSGCWDRVEISDRNFVITLGIDGFQDTYGMTKLNDVKENR